MSLHIATSLPILLISALLTEMHYQSFCNVGPSYRLCPFFFIFHKKYVYFYVFKIMFSDRGLDICKLQLFCKGCNFQPNTTNYVSIKSCHNVPAIFQINQKSWINFTQFWHKSKVVRKGSMPICNLDRKGSSYCSKLQPWLLMGCTQCPSKYSKYTN